MEHNHLVSVAAMVHNDEGKILLVNSPWRGWEYPGRLLEPREPFEEALRRELREQSGLEVEFISFVGTRKHVEKNIVNIDFPFRSLSGALTTITEPT